MESKTLIIIPILTLIALSLAGISITTAYSPAYLPVTETYGMPIYTFKVDSQHTLYVVYQYAIVGGLNLVTTNHTIEKAYYIPALETVALQFADGIGYYKPSTNTLVYKPIKSTEFINGFHLVNDTVYTPLLQPIKLPSGAVLLDAVYTTQPILLLRIGSTIYLYPSMKPVFTGTASEAKILATKTTLYVIVYTGEHLVLLDTNGEIINTYQISGNYKLIIHKGTIYLVGDSETLVFGVYTNKLYFLTKISGYKYAEPPMFYYGPITKYVVAGVDKNPIIYCIPGHAYMVVGVSAITSLDNSLVVYPLTQPAMLKLLDTRGIIYFILPPGLIIKTKIQPGTYIVPSNTMMVTEQGAMIITGSMVFPPPIPSNTGGSNELPPAPIITYVTGYSYSKIADLPLTHYYLFDNGVVYAENGLLHILYFDGHEAVTPINYNVVAIMGIENYVLVYDGTKLHIYSLSLQQLRTIPMPSMLKPIYATMTPTEIVLYTEKYKMIYNLVSATVEKTTYTSSDKIELSAVTTYVPPDKLLIGVSNQDTISSLVSHITPSGTKIYTAVTSDGRKIIVVTPTATYIHVLEQGAVSQAVAVAPQLIYCISGNTVYSISPNIEQTTGYIIKTSPTNTSIIAKIYNIELRLSGPTAMIVAPPNTEIDLKVSAPGYTPFTKTMKIPAYMETINISLTRAEGTLAITPSLQPPLTTSIVRTVVLSINNKTIEIPADSTKELYLPYGTYRITVLGAKPLPPDAIKHMIITVKLSSSKQSVIVPVYLAKPVIMLKTERSTNATIVYPNGTKRTITLQAGIPAYITAPPGKYEIISGTEPATKKATLSVTSTNIYKIDVTPPEPGTLIVIAPEGTTIMVMQSGKILYTGKPTTLKLAPGVYIVKAVLGQLTKTEQVILQPGKTTTLRIEFEHTTATTPIQAKHQIPSWLIPAVAGAVIALLVALLLLRHRRKAGKKVAEASAEEHGETGHETIEM